MLRFIEDAPLDEDALDVGADAVRLVMQWGNKGKEGNGYYCARVAVAAYLQELKMRPVMNDA